MSRFRIIALAAVVTAVGACASGGTRSERGGTAAERSLARWQAVVSGNPEQAYDYYTPGVRSTKTREDYAKEMRQKPVKYASPRIEGEECDADRCTVAVALEFEIAIQLPGMVAQKHPAVLEEQWIRLDGIWYYLPDDFR